jgi:hypothetical protein
MSRRVAYVHVDVKLCSNITCLAPNLIQKSQQQVSDLYNNDEYIENCKILVRVTAFGQAQESKCLQCMDTLHQIDLSHESFNFEALFYDTGEPDESKLKREVLVIELVQRCVWRTQFLPPSSFVTEKKNKNQHTQDIILGSKSIPLWKIYLESKNFESIKLDERPRNDIFKLLSTPIIHMKAVVSVVPPVQIPTASIVDRPIAVTINQTKSTEKTKAKIMPIKRKSEADEYIDTYYHLLDDSSPVKSPRKRRKTIVKSRKKLYERKLNTCDQPTKIVEYHTHYHTHIINYNSDAFEKYLSDEQKSKKESIQSSTSSTTVSPIKNKKSRKSDKEQNELELKNLTSSDNEYDTYIYRKKPFSDETIMASKRVHITKEHPAYRSKPTVAPIERRPRRIYSEEPDKKTILDIRSPLEENIIQARESIWRVDIKKELKEARERITKHAQSTDSIIENEVLQFNATREADQIMQRKLSGYVRRTYKEYLQTRLI